MPRFYSCIVFVLLTMMFSGCATIRAKPVAEVSQMPAAGIGVDCRGWEGECFWQLFTPDDYPLCSPANEAEVSLLPLGNVINMSWGGSVLRVWHLVALANKPEFVPSSWLPPNGSDFRQVCDPVPGKNMRGDNGFHCLAFMGSGLWELTFKPLVQLWARDVDFVAVSR